MSSMSRSGPHEAGATLRLAVVIGSVREGRFGPVVAQWFAERAGQHGRFAVDVIDLADTPLPLALPPEPPALNPDMQRPAAMAGLTRRLTEADAVVVVTPAYNGSFPASLKCAIDWHHDEWQTKPVGFVSYSGGQSGAMAVEQLRQVFTVLNAVPLRETVAFPRYYELFGPDGKLLDPAGPDAAAKVMLDQLGWWAALLRDARHDRPPVPIG